jgi:excinuclease UvrABC helicase subunit UvrB
MKNYRGDVYIFAKSYDDAAESALKIKEKKRLKKGIDDEPYKVNKVEMINYYYSKANKKKFKNLSVDELEKDLQKAIEKENYEKASKIRNRIKKCNKNERRR